MLNTGYEYSVLKIRSHFIAASIRRFDRNRETDFDKQKYQSTECWGIHGFEKPQLQQITNANF